MVRRDMCHPVLVASAMGGEAPRKLVITGFRGKGEDQLGHNDKISCCQYRFGGEGCELDGNRSSPIAIRVV